MNFKLEITALRLFKIDNAFLLSVSMVNYSEKPLKQTNLLCTRFGTLLLVLGTNQMFEQLGSGLVVPIILLLKYEGTIKNKKI